jgi:hypothetical protein
VLALNICQRLGDEYKHYSYRIVEVLKNRPENPRPNPDDEGFMDHALFSSLILFQQIAASSSEKNPLNNVHIDVLSAIALHNSLFKYTIKKGGYREKNLTL